MAVKALDYSALQCCVCLATEGLVLEVQPSNYVLSCDTCGAIILLPIGYSLRQVKLLLAYHLPDPAHPFTDYEWN